MTQTLTDDSSKQRLVDTGIRLFAQLNGHEVSNRRLAKEARVNHAMINYHFGNRDGLCEAIFNHALEQWSAIILPILNKAEKALEQANSNSDLEQITRQMVGAVLGAVTGDRSSQFLAVLLNEDLAMPKQYFNRLFKEVLAPFHSTATKVAAKVNGTSETGLESIIMGQVIVAQCMTFFRGRVLLFRKLTPVVDTQMKTDAITQVVADSVVAGLGLGK